MDDFLQKNVGATEPGMIIVATSASVSGVVDLLVGYMYEVAPRPVFLNSIESNSKRTVVSEKELGSQTAKFYDVLMSITSGGQQIPFLNSKSSLIFVCSASFIETEQMKGRDWLSLCGLTYNFTE